jgi:hypothetical protein
VVAFAPAFAAGFFAAFAVPAFTLRVAIAQPSSGDDTAARLFAGRAIPYRAADAAPARRRRGRR